MRTFSILVFFLLSLPIFAQPGPGYETLHVNFNDFDTSDCELNPLDPMLNSIQHDPFSSPIKSGRSFAEYRTSYFVDSTTDLSRLELLQWCPRFNELNVYLPYLPSEITEYGTYLTDLKLSNPHTDRYNARDPNRASVENAVIANLNDLAKLTRLKNFEISGFTISVPKNATSYQTSKEMIKLTTYEYRNCIIDNLGPNNAVNRFIFSECQFKKSKLKLDEIGERFGSVEIQSHRDSIIDFTLPKRLGNLEIRSNPKLEIIRFNLTEIYRFKLDNCMNLKKLDGQLAPYKMGLAQFRCSTLILPQFFKAIEKVTEIDECAIYIEDGTANIDFINRDLTINKLTLKATGNDVKFNFSPFIHVTISTFHFLGYPLNVPTFSRRGTLESCVLEIGNYPTTVKGDEFLNSLHGINSLFILGGFFTSIPDSFFKNNPTLVELFVRNTQLTELTFGDKVMFELKHISLTHNTGITAIPDRKYYPHADISIHNYAY